MSAGEAPSLWGFVALSGNPRTRVLAGRGWEGLWAAPGTRDSRWSRPSPSPSPTAFAKSLSRTPGNRCILEPGGSLFRCAGKGLARPSSGMRVGSCHVTLWHVPLEPCWPQRLEPSPSCHRQPPGSWPFGWRPQSMGMPGGGTGKAHTALSTGTISPRGWLLF